MKESDRAKKNSISVGTRDGILQLRFPRAMSRHCWNVEQKKPSIGWEASRENWEKATDLARWMERDYSSGKFDPSLVKYGFETIKEVTVEAPRKSIEQELLEAWDVYCEDIETDLEETTFLSRYRGLFLNIIKLISVFLLDELKKISEATNSEVKEISFDIALKTRKWLLEHYSRETTKRFLSQLEYCINFAILRKKWSYGELNPFIGMSKKLSQVSTTRRPKKGFSPPPGSNPREFEDRRAYGLEDRNKIIQKFLSSAYSYFAPVIIFLFLTGCRLEDVPALRCCDVYINLETKRGHIYIHQAYSPRFKLLKTTKTGKHRYFPVVDPDLVTLLLERIKDSNPNDLLFPAQDGSRLNMDMLSAIWGSANYKGEPGLVLQLANAGEIVTYLTLNSCRHTFISLQINVGKINVVPVSEWVGNSPEVIYKNYLQSSEDVFPAIMPISLLGYEPLITSSQVPS